MATSERHLQPRAPSGLDGEEGLERSPTFERLWPSAAARLDHILMSRNVPGWLREEVVQETGVRIWTRWDRLYFAGDLLPLARTIASNLITDHHREATRLVLTDDAPDGATERTDVERSAIARIDLDQVRAALSELNPRYRQALLAEIGESAIQETAELAKVTRLRARRRLRAVIERSRIAVVTQVRTLIDLLRRGAQATGQSFSGVEIQSLLQAALGISLMVSALVALTFGPDPSPRRSGGPSLPFDANVASSGEREGFRNSPSGATRAFRSGRKSSEGSPPHPIGYGYEPGDGNGSEFPFPDVDYPGGEAKNGGSIDADGVVQHGEHSYPVGDDQLTVKYDYRAKAPDCRTRPDDPDCDVHEPYANTQVAYGERSHKVEVGSRPRD